MKETRIIWLLLFLIAFGCNKSKEASIQKEEHAHENKNKGNILPGNEHGFEQSPVNINSSANSKGNHDITLYFQDKINKIENLGHTVQLNFEEGSYIKYNDTLFAFKQCHFHTPSEHLIDSISYPMEMHIVNIMPNDNPKVTPQYLVIGVLFKEGKENKFIAEFLNAIPKKENNATEITTGTVKLHDLFSDVPKETRNNFYHYKGSLTTPPYTETVKWFVIKHVFEASKEQIEAIHSVEGDNARQVQALYGRSISTN